MRVLRALDASSLHHLVEDGLEAQGGDEPQDVWYFFSEAALSTRPTLVMVLAVRMVNHGLIGLDSQLLHKLLDCYEDR